MDEMRERLLKKVLADPPSLLRNATQSELEDKCREMIGYMSPAQVEERLANYPAPPRAAALVPTTEEAVTPEDEARWRIAARRPQRSYVGAPYPLTASQRAELDADVREVLGEDVRASYRLRPARGGGH